MTEAFRRAVLRLFVLFVRLELFDVDRAAEAVTYRSDKSDGPTAGTETVDPLEFLARVLVHIPDKGRVTTRQIFEVDPLVCPQCAGTMRIVACITQAAVIDQILTHLRTRAAAAARAGASSPPSVGASVARGARQRQPARAAPLHAP